MCECNQKIIEVPKKLTFIKKYCLGTHIPLLKTFYETITQPYTKNCLCFQFFMGSPRTYQYKILDPSDYKQTLEYCNKNNLSFYIHAPYVLNLARDDATKATNTMINSLKQIEGLPCSYVVHMGAKGTIENVAQHVNELNLKFNSHNRVPKQLLLENSAGQGTSLGTTVNELRKLYEGLDTSKVGLCLDTAHTFASGMSEFKNYEDLNKLFDEIEAITKISLIHLNDSMVPYNHCIDRHESIGEGYIWDQNDVDPNNIKKIRNEIDVDSSLIALLRRATEKKINIVLETPTPGSDLELMRKLY